MTRSETLINLVINQVAVYESESLNHSWLVQKHWFIQDQNNTAMLLRDEVWILPPQLMPVHTKHDKDKYIVLKTVLNI